MAKPNDKKENPKKGDSKPSKVPQVPTPPQVRSVKESKDTSKATNLITEEKKKP